jgi:hypothetical protein
MDLFDWFFKQPVTEGEMDEAFDNAEQADQSIMNDQGLVGVMVNGDVAEHFPTPDLTVDIATPVVAYDQEGQRVFIPGTGGVENVDVSVDSNAVSTAVAGGGNEKIVSVFIQFARALSNPRIDGNSATVDFNVDESFEIIVEQGAEAAPPATPPALKADALLLCDITRTNGQTQIFNADIDLSRKESTFKLTTATFTIDAGTQEEALQDMLQEIQNHVDQVGAAHDADAIVYDPTALPIPAAWSAIDAATDVQAALDGIVDDLSQATGVTGASLVGFDPSGNNFTASNIAAALVEAAVLAAASQVFTGTNTFDDLQISDENSITDAGADDAAARDTPVITTSTTTVGSNLQKKLIYEIEISTALLRMYAMGNGLEVTINARWDNTGSDWNRDTAGSDSHLYRFTVNRGFEYIEHLNSEADGWADSAWFGTGRRAGFDLVGVGEEIEVSDGGVLAPGPTVAYVAFVDFNSEAGATATGASATLPCIFPGNPSSVTVLEDITATGFSVVPAPNTFRPMGFRVSGSINATALGTFTRTFDVS